RDTVGNTAAAPAKRRSNRRRASVMASPHELQCLPAIAEGFRAKIERVSDCSPAGGITAAFAFHGTSASPAGSSAMTLHRLSRRVEGARDVRRWPVFPAHRPRFMSLHLGLFTV